MKLKGNVLMARKAFVEKQFGPAGWRQVLSALAPEEAAILEERLTPVGWFPFELGQHLDAAIVKVLGNGRPAVFEALGEASARENLATVHKDFLVVGDPQAFMRRAPTIYKFYYDIGHRTYEPTGPSSGVLTTHDAETYSLVDCLTVVGWYKEALHQCGAKSVTIREPECRAKGKPHCRYEISWTM
jgi:uncharacterized protein (TIGR02265 family)